MPSYVTDANLSSYELAFCGGMAGVISRYFITHVLHNVNFLTNDFNRVVIAPLDVVKIRMQLQTHRTHFGFKRQQVSTTTVSPNVKYSKISQALKTILKEEGIRVKKNLRYSL